MKVTFTLDRVKSYDENEHFCEHPTPLLTRASLLLPAPGWPGHSISLLQSWSWEFPSR